MKSLIKMKFVASMLTLFSIAFSSSVFAQLPSPNASGISTGHTHLTVPNAAKHTEIWKMLGGEIVMSGRLQALRFPGMYIILTEAEPTAPSASTSANHIGFEVQSYALYKAKLEAIGANLFVDNAETGQILADFPDGVRVEFQEVDGLADPIVFHHTHLSVLESEELRAWYLEVLGAEAGERRGLPSAVIPGGRVDFIPARGDAPLPSRGAAIDHIGFEVADMDVFAARMEAMGIEFDRGPTVIDAINLEIAFITDPAGTYIELTEGLDNIE
jgi:catechol 2,3-dioxygenase-like lactoylglutathione lyase family enzyme